MNRTEFDQKFQDKSLKLCFIGMSNIGKSHASRLLRDSYGFEFYEVDGAIQAAIDVPDMEEANEWMGYPYEEKYKTRVKEYLALEAEKTINISPPLNTNFILDTTGSVINLEPHVLEKLKSDYLIVSFDVGLNMCQEMIEAYFTSPKTVVWGDVFQQKPGEQGIDALRRCYPKLLEDRIERYRALGDVTIPGEFSRTKGLEAQRMFEILRLSLPV